MNDLTSQYNGLAIPFKAANDDFTAMTNYMQKAGINDASTPIINQIQQAINKGFLKPGADAAFKTYISSIRSNYASLLAAKSGSVVGVNEEATALIPDKLGIPDMIKLQQALNVNGKNVMDATQSQLQQKLQQIPGAMNIPQSQGGSQSQSGNGWY